MGLFTDDPSLPPGPTDEEETESGFKKIEPDEKKEPEIEEEKNMAEVELEVKPRTDADLAELMYGKSEGIENDEGVEEPEQPQKLKDRTEEEIAAVVYPEKSPLYADVDENGNVSACIRELETRRIMAQSRYGNQADLVGRSSPLPFADLSNIKLVGKSLDHGNYHDSSIADCNCEGLSATWANLQRLNAEGSNLSKANLGFSDLRGMKVSFETDISQANFEGAAIDRATYDGLIKCKGASSAKGLAVREMPAKR